MFGKRRLAAMAAMVALAVIAGAPAARWRPRAVASRRESRLRPRNHALETSVGRIDADVVTLKAGSNGPRRGRQPVQQDRRQARSASRRRRPRPPPSSQSSARPSKSCAPRAAGSRQRGPRAADGAEGGHRHGDAGRAAPSARCAQHRGRPAADGRGLGPARCQPWRRADRRPACLYEVYAGDPVPGLGRVDAIRRQDGRWVVVTSRGLDRRALRSGRRRSGRCTVLHFDCETAGLFGYFPQ